MRRTMTRIGLLPLALVLVASGCREAPAPVAEPVRSIKTMTVSEPGTGQVRRFPGVVEAVVATNLSFEVGGNIREILVNPGDRVVTGQPLAKLDETPLRISVESAEAELGRAKAMLAEKENEFDRKRTLFHKDWVSKATYDQAEAARDGSANQVSFALSKLNMTRRDLEKTVLAAPFDGVIASRAVERFQEVARGQTIFEIYAEGGMEVAIAVPENAISRIHLGLPGDVTFPSDHTKPLQGRISEIGSAASEANAFPVKVALIDPSSGIMPGMTAEVRLVLEDETDTSYFVPLSAIVAVQPFFCKSV